LEWNGSLAKNGYGNFHLNGKTEYAHRVAWELANGPSDLFILHRCDNRKCVNVEHLFLGTFDENMADMVAKKRQAYGERSGRAKLSDKDILAIRASNELQASLASRFNVTQSHISMVRARKTRWLVDKI